jgi:hypothetical protein
MMFDRSPMSTELGTKTIKLYDRVSILFQNFGALVLKLEEPFILTVMLSLQFRLYLY